MTMQCKQVDIGDKCVECLRSTSLDQVFSLTEYQPIMITISVGYAQSVTSMSVIVAMKKFIVMKIALLMMFMILSNHRIF